MDLNGWFDSVPRLTVDLGPRRLSAFRALGVLGFHVALVVAVLVSLVNGVPLVSALGLSAVAGLSFFAWALVRRAVTGRESLVALEHVWVALAAVGAFLWLSGSPVVAGLDVLAVALCWFLAFGRLGCAAVGCCHGLPSRVGLAYGPRHGLPPRLTGRRLFPVQVLEALGLAAIGVVGLLLAVGPPGRATVWFLVAYASLRFGSEALREGDRPGLWGLSTTRAMCVLQAAAAVVAAEAWLVPGPPGRAAVVGGATLLATTALAIGVVLARGQDPLVAAPHLDDTWSLITVLARPAGTAPRVGCTTLGMTVAVSDDGDGALHVSLSHPSRPTSAVALALGPDDLVERSGITHLLLSTQPVPSGAGPTREHPRAERLRPAGDGRSWAAPAPADDYFGRTAATSVGSDGA